MLRLLQQFRLSDQIQAQRFAADAVVVFASDLDQATPSDTSSRRLGRCYQCGYLSDVGDLLGLALSTQHQGVRFTGQLAGHLHLDKSALALWLGVSTRPCAVHAISAVIEVSRNARQIDGIEANLDDKGRDAVSVYNLVPAHSGVLARNKYASNLADVLEDLQQLLRGDGHGHGHGILQ